MKVWLVWWNYGYSDTKDRLLVVCDSEKDAIKVKLEWEDKLPQVFYNAYFTDQILISGTELEAMHESY